MSASTLPHDHGQTAEKIAASLPSTEEFRLSADLFRQLSDATRLKIFWILCHCEACVINLAAMMEMSSPAVSHHLRQLKEDGLVLARREGKEVYYQAANDPRVHELHRIVETLMDITCP